MTGKLEVSLDKLPIKCPDLIEEKILERFPPDVGYEEKRESLIGRIDFAWAVEKDEKKKKKLSRESSAAQWELQSMVENLHLAHQESSPSLSISSTLQATNDAVKVASMTRPRPFPNEALSDLAVSAATKLQCFQEICSMNRYDCDLADLPVIILQQVASQVIRWLHEEARKIGRKANRDFLCLSFELEQGETLSYMWIQKIVKDASRGGWSWRMVL